MPEQQVILTIDEDGKITAKTFGFQGEACLDAVTELLSETTNISNVKKTDEFYQSQHVSQSRKVTLKQGNV